MPSEIKTVSICPWCIQMAIQFRFFRILQWPEMNTIPNLAFFHMEEREVLLVIVIGSQPCSWVHEVNKEIPGI